MRCPVKKIASPNLLCTGQSRNLLRFPILKLALLKSEQ
jgi:hypothetical protein